MPMSEEAATGLRAAVAWNPGAAKYLMHILRDFPMGVRYKEQDRYGPLGMMLFALPPTKHITDKVNIPLKPHPFPQEKLQACEVFNEEWLQQRFTKAELADAIECMLKAMKAQPLLKHVDASSTLVFTAQGTFLSNDMYTLEPGSKIDLEEEQ